MQVLETAKLAGVVEQLKDDRDKERDSVGEEWARFTKKGVKNFLFGQIPEE